jgi:hypothetical protein
VHQRIDEIWKTVIHGWNGHVRLECTWMWNGRSRVERGVPVILELPAERSNPKEVAKEIEAFALQQPGNQIQR